MQYTKEIQTGRQAIEYGDKVDDFPEKILQKNCEELLDWHKLPYWRMPDSLLRYIATKAPVQYKKILSRYFTGKPDLTILFPSGQYLNVELKTEKGKLTGGQKRFARQSKIYIVRSYDDFEKMIEDKLNDKYKQRHS